MMRKSLPSVLARLCVKCLVILSVVLALCSGATLVRAAQRNAPGAELREAHGTVVDKDEKPLGAAVVYLKNDRTLTVKTYISDDKGEYHFSGLDPNVDYEIHAEHDDQTSPNHTISSFDSRKEIVVTLKVDHEKKKG
jgi:hypothetical protein